MTQNKKKIKQFKKLLSFTIFCRLFTLLLFSLVVYPPILFKLLMLLGIMSTCGLIYYLWLERDLEFVYGVIYSYYAFFLLQWIFPYAFFTVRDRRWLTR